MKQRKGTEVMNKLMEVEMIKAFQKLDPFIQTREDALKFVRQNWRQMFRDKEWWDARKHKYPFHLTVPTSLMAPHKWPGDHCSVVLEKGYRTWGFKTFKKYTAFAAIA